MMVQGGEVKNSDVGNVTQVRCRYRVEAKFYLASLTDQEAAVFVVKTMVVRRDSVMFDGEPCRAPALTRHREDAARYLREGYHARVGYLGLPETIAAIDSDCTEALLKSGGKIVVFWTATFLMP